MNSATASGLASDKKTHSTSRLHHGKLRQIRCRCFQRTRQWTFSRIPGDMIAVHLFISRLLSKKKWPSLRRKMSALKKVRRKTRIVVFVHEQSLPRSLFFFLFLLLLNVISGASNGGFGVVVFFDRLKPECRTWPRRLKVYISETARSSARREWVTVWGVFNLLGCSSFLHRSVSGTQWCTLWVRWCGN